MKLLFTTVLQLVLTTGAPFSSGYFGCAPAKFTPGAVDNGGCLMQISSIYPTGSNVKSVSNGCYTCLKMSFCRKNDIAQCNVRAAINGVDRTSGFLTYVCDADKLTKVKAGPGAGCDELAQGPPSKEWFLNSDNSGASVNFIEAETVDSCNFVLAIKGWGGSSTIPVPGKNVNLSINQYSLAVHLDSFVQKGIDGSWKPVNATYKHKPAPINASNSAMNIQSRLRTSMRRQLQSSDCGVIEDTSYCGATDDDVSVYMDQPVRYATPMTVTFDSRKNIPDVWVAGLCDSSLTQGTQTEVTMNLPNNPDWKRGTPMLRFKVYDLECGNEPGCVLCSVDPTPNPNNTPHSCKFTRTPDLEYVLIKVSGFSGTTPVEYALTMTFSK